MSRFRFRLPSILVLILLLGVSGCGGRELEKFPENRYMVHLYTTDGEGFKTFGEYMGLSIEDISDKCKSTPQFTRLCKILAILQAGQINSFNNYQPVFISQIKIQGYSLVYDRANPRSAILLLPRPKNNL